MSARLVPLTPGPAPPIPLERPVILIGRHLDCDFRINIPQVSRRHCCVAQVEEQWVLRDLGSRNGVRINGYRVEESAIVPGDEVAIGPLLFRLDAIGPGPQAPPPAPGDVAPDPDEDGDLVPLDD